MHGQGRSGEGWLKKGVHLGLLVATIGGLAVALWVFRSIGLGAVAEAARRIGWGGAILYWFY